MAEFHVIGVMSGTSLDGLDMLHTCLSETDTGKWRYELLHAQTVAYPPDLRARIVSAMQASGLELALLHTDYGHFVGRQLRCFTEKHTLRPDFAAVHGHTVFHQPVRGLSLQIGNGAAMAVESGLVIVNDFRTSDVALGGQGAPLVPIGDGLLFSDYDFCLNLGGISNISYVDRKGIRIAYDISPCNMALNYYSARLGSEYDRDGLWARSGRLLPELQEPLDRLAYYHVSPPKSLGQEWFEQEFLPVVHSFERTVHTVRTEDILHTLVEHIAGQIASVCRSVIAGENRADEIRKTMLLTGGGALNLYLRERIGILSGVSLAPVDRLLVDYKEALIFALLGVLRVQGKENCLRSVTGARRDSIGGAVYLP